MTVTVREKGRALEDGGGLVMTSNAWMAPAIPAMKELADFEQRYWKAIAPEAAGMSAEQMAAVMAMYPMLKQAMERLKEEGTKLEGTPLATTTVFEAVKSKDQVAQESQQSRRRRSWRHARAQDHEERRQAPRHGVHPRRTRPSK